MHVDQFGNIVMHIKMFSTLRKDQTLHIISDHFPYDAYWK